MSEGFSNKVVIVTGAGSGIGRATALGFAKEGAHVVVADIGAETGEETVAAIQAQGGSARFVATDVSRSDSVNALVNSAIDQWGRLDVYVGNAGIIDGLLPCGQVTDEIWSRVLGVNLGGCFYGSRAALPHLAKTRGNIVLTASVAALRGMAGGTAYTASKHGVLGLINQIAAEYGAQGIRVNGVAPGPIRTNISPEMMADPKTDEWARAMTTLGRWGMPEEVASAILFLASDAASYITGTLLRVDGGWCSK